MKKYLLRFTAPLLTLWAAVGLDAAINPAVVPAEARWVVFADLDALRTSAIGKELIALAEKGKVDTGAGKVGIDWQKLLATIGSATAYGTNLSPDAKDIDGALVIEGTADLRKIAESILIQMNLADPKVVEELSALPFPAYLIKESKAKAPPTTATENGSPKAKASAAAAPLEVIVAFPPEPIIIVSKSKAQVLKARDVFRGAAPSVASAANAPLKKFAGSAKGAYLFAASTVPAGTLFPEDGPQGRILKMANSGSLALGERGENVFAHSELVASSSQMGEKLMKILQGLTAMLSLAETNDKQLAEFLDSAVVNRSGDTVTLDLAYSSARLAQMIKQLQQAPQARVGERAATRLPQMINGTALAEWQTAKIEAGTVANAGEVTITRTIEKVSLKNGTLVTLARHASVGKMPRWEQIEIEPTAGGGAPLVFRPEFMRAAGQRGLWSQFQFPGADGTYTLKVAYVSTPGVQAAFAVSIKDPVPRPSPAAASAPTAPATKE
jgi:hypothetical protein